PKRRGGAEEVFLPLSASGRGRGGGVLSATPKRPTVPDVPAARPVLGLSQRGRGTAGEGLAPRRRAARRADQRGPAAPVARVVRPGGEEQEPDRPVRASPLPPADGQVPVGRHYRGGRRGDD